jgi:1,5-anhydro-D-fructose reductase (1,5-anhydro-D-mannitol-forming)
VEATAVVDVEPGFEVDTLALALLRFDNGALAYVNANQSLPNPQQDLSIHGTEGAVLGRDVTRPHLRGSISVIRPDGAEERAVSSAEAFSRTIGDFAGAVLAGTDPSPSGVDGLRSVELIDALARSVRDRRTVRLGG